MSQRCLLRGTRCLSSFASGRVNSLAEAVCDTFGAVMPQPSSATNDAVPKAIVVTDNFMAHRRKIISGAILDRGRNFIQPPFGRHTEGKSPFRSPMHYVLRRTPSPTRGEGISYLKLAV